MPVTLCTGPKSAIPWNIVECIANSMRIEEEAAHCKRATSLFSSISACGSNPAYGYPYPYSYPRKHKLNEITVAQHLTVEELRRVGGEDMWSLWWWLNMNSDANFVCDWMKVSSHLFLYFFSLFSLIFCYSFLCSMPFVEYWVYL